MPRAVRARTALRTVVRLTSSSTARSRSEGILVPTGQTSESILPSRNDSTCAWMDSAAFFWMIFRGSKVSSCLPPNSVPSRQRFPVNQTCQLRPMVVTICNHYHRNAETVKPLQKREFSDSICERQHRLRQKLPSRQAESRSCTTPHVVDLVDLHLPVEQGDDESDGTNDSVPQATPEACNDPSCVGGIDGNHQGPARTLPGDRSGAEETAI